MGQNFDNATVKIVIQPILNIFYQIGNMPFLKCTSQKFRVQCIQYENRPSQPGSLHHPYMCLTLSNISMDQRCLHAEKNRYITLQNKYTSNVLNLYMYVQIELESKHNHPSPPPPPWMGLATQFRGSEINCIPQGRWIGIFFYLAFPRLEVLLGACCCELSGCCM